MSLERMTRRWVQSSEAGSARLEGRASVNAAIRSRPTLSSSGTCSLSTCALRSLGRKREWMRARRAGGMECLVNSLGAGDGLEHYERRAVSWCRRRVSSANAVA